MKALVYTGTRRMRLAEVDEPTPAAGQAVVAVSHCGICGSDMHAWHGHDPRRVPPLVLGHEAVGVALNGRFSGQRVAINPLMTCGRCPACSAGREHLCPERELIGMRVPGAFAEKVAVSEDNLIPIADEFAFEQAVFAEPLACVVHASRLAVRASPTPLGEARVTVLGGGAIGLLAALVFHHQGAASLAVAETNSLRRACVQAVGAGDVYDPMATTAPGGASDIVFDAVGSGRTRAEACRLVRAGGVIVHIGLQDSEPGFDTRHVTLQEITFVGSYCYGRKDFADSLKLLADGVVTGSGWSEFRPLVDGVRAFEDIHNGAAAAKIVLGVA